MDNHNLQLHHDFYQQIQDHLDNQKVPGDHLHTPNNDRNNHNHQQHVPLIHTDHLAVDVVQNL